MASSELPTSRSSIPVTPSPFIPRDTTPEAWALHLAALERFGP